MSQQSLVAKPLRESPRRRRTARQRRRARARRPRVAASRDNCPMAVVFEKPSLMTRVLPWFKGFDGPLLSAVAKLSV